MSFPYVISNVLFIFFPKYCSSCYPCSYLSIAKHIFLWVKCPNTILEVRFFPLPHFDHIWPGGSTLCVQYILTTENTCNKKKLIVSKAASPKALTNWPLNWLKTFQQNRHWDHIQILLRSTMIHLNNKSYILWKNVKTV